LDRRTILKNIKNN